MKSISIYTITRNQNIEQLQKLEHQLSGRDYFLKIREWELESMKALTAELETCMEDVYALRFFYSFQIPRLGKEFDLLQIKEDQIVNIELKSGVVSDEAICRQLLQNRYYLSVLGRTIHSYTYISSQNRLVRLTNHDHIAEADWDELCRALKRKSPDYDGNIEELFRAELYLISPLREPERFLQKEYFLTAQQRDIERQILKGIRAKHSDYYWFSGLPGTGKTLLLYDLAMKLSVRQRVCMIHCGESGEDWRILHKRLRRIDFLSDRQLSLQAAKQTMTENVCAEEAFDTFLKPYSAILVDEAHLLSVEQLKILEECKKQIPIIFSSDTEDMISPEELDREIPQRLAGLPDVQSFGEGDLQNRAHIENGSLSFPDAIEFAVMLDPTPANALIPRTMAASIRVGLFKNQQLVAWAEPISDEEQTSYQGFDNATFYRLEPLSFPFAAGDILETAVLLTDEYGRETICPGNFPLALSNDGQSLIFPGSTGSDTVDAYSIDTDISHWTFQ